MLTKPRSHTISWNLCWNIFCSHRKSASEINFLSTYKSETLFCSRNIGFSGYRILGFKLHFPEFFFLLVSNVPDKMSEVDITFALLRVTFSFLLEALYVDVLTQRQSGSRHEPFYSLSYLELGFFSLEMTLPSFLETFLLSCLYSFKLDKSCPFPWFKKLNSLMSLTVKLVISSPLPGNLYFQCFQSFGICSVFLNSML